jgi:hypothetical protein
VVKLPKVSVCRSCARTCCRRVAGSPSIWKCWPSSPKTRSGNGSTMDASGASASGATGRMGDSRRWSRSNSEARCSRARQGTATAKRGGASRRKAWQGRCWATRGSARRGKGMAQRSSANGEVGRCIAGLGKGGASRCGAVHCVAKARRGGAPLCGVRPSKGTALRGSAQRTEGGRCMGKYGRGVVCRAPFPSDAQQFDG